MTFDPPPGAASIPPISMLRAWVDSEVARIRREPPAPGARREHRDATFFMGPWVGALSMAIQLDPFLDPAETRLYGALIALMDRQRKDAAAVQPNYNELMRFTRIGSRASLASAIAMLRLHRWITVAARLRRDDGRHVGNLIAVHPEPLPIADTLVLDPEWIDFVQRTAREHHRRRVRDAAARILSSLARRIDAGENLSESSALQAAEERQASLSAVLGGEGNSFFGVTLDAMPAQTRDATRDATRRRTRRADQDRNAPASSLSELPPTDSTGVHSVNSVDFDPVHSVNSEQYRVHSVNPDEKTRTYDPVHSVNGKKKEEDIEVLLSQPGEEPSHARGRELPGILPRTEDVRGENGEALHWPELPRNMLGLIAADAAKLPAELRQIVLDELGGRVRVGKITTNAIGYFRRLCEDAREGHVPASAYAFKEQARRGKSAAAPPEGGSLTPSRSTTRTPDVRADVLAQRWRACVDAIADDIGIDAVSTLIRPIRVRARGGAIELLAPNRFVADASNEHLPKIRQWWSAHAPEMPQRLILHVG